jgi:hypothetical protein
MRNYSLVYDPERSFFGILKARLLLSWIVWWMRTWLTGHSQEFDAH